MGQKIDALGMLDLMVHPGFCVQDHKIIRVNPPAEALMITEGTDVTTLLATGKEEYAAFEDGCLYLMLDAACKKWGASVSRIGNYHVFILEQDADQSELQAMALAARELREPLANIMTTADRLFPMIALDADSFTQEQVARLNRGLFQMLRVVSNMSDAHRIESGSSSRQETVNIRELFDEVFVKAQQLVEHTGLTLHYSGLGNSMFCLADKETLERAVLNILSNAIKFTPKGGTIEATVSRHGNQLRLCVLDSGSGIAENLRNSVYSRYLRQPAIEDSRFGIGLGMVLIRAAATEHGGTVLIDHPQGKGTRVTMTMEIRQSTSPMVRSNVFTIDYAGERDHSLIELSDCLPASLYDSKKIN